MLFENPQELKERIETVAGRTVRGRVRVLDDTSDYMEVYSGTVLRLEGNDYFIRGEAKEGRFGIDDQPKLWVKYAVDLEDGSRKVLKLVFHEQFSTQLGPLTVRCVRDPEKESRVLALTAGDDRFMQGRTVLDSKGNNVRVVDHIRGASLFNHVAGLQLSHEEYFHTMLPDLLRRILGCIDAMERLHQEGEQHGDIRNDHILIETDPVRFRWIDFDYRVNYLDYDLFGMGNILNYAVGKGIHTRRGHTPGQSRRTTGGPRLESEDALLFYPYRLANLRKLYPYIPPMLSEMLMRFSIDATDFYESCAEMAIDLRAILEAEFPASR